MSVDPPDDVWNTLTLEPFAVVFAKTIALEYERRLLPWLSVAAGPSFTTGDTTTGGDAAVTGSYFAWGATLAARFYPWNEAPSGAFVSPFGGLAWASAEAGDDTSDGFGWSVGGLAGYTWILGRYFVFSIGAGAAWLDMDVMTNGTSHGKRGVYPALRLAIGGAF